MNINESVNLYPACLTTTITVCYYEVWSSLTKQKFAELHFAWAGQAVRKVRRRNWVALDQHCSTTAFVVCGKTIAQLPQSCLSKSSQKRPNQCFNKCFWTPFWYSGCFWEAFCHISLCYNITGKQVTATEIIKGVTPKPFQRQLRLGQRSLNRFSR